MFGSDLYISLILGVLISLIFAEKNRYRTCRFSRAGLFRARF